MTFKNQIILDSMYDKDFKIIRSVHQTRYGEHWVYYDNKKMMVCPRPDINGNVWDLICAM